MKSLIQLAVAFLLLLGISTDAQAQEKESISLNSDYTYSIVDLHLTGVPVGKITFSEVGKEYEIIKSNGCKFVGDLTCVLDFIESKLKQGWVIVSSDFNDNHVYFFLKKQK